MEGARARPGGSARELIKGEFRSYVPTVNSPNISNGDSSVLAQTNKKRKRLNWRNVRKCWSESCSGDFELNHVILLSVKVFISQGKLDFTRVNNCPPQS